MSPIRWMARNHVAANLLMLFLIVGGLLASRSLTIEVFPEVEMDVVTVSVAYPGAGPEEVEEGVCAPIEEAVHGLQGVKRVLSTAQEGGGGVTVEVIEGEDVDLVLQDIKAAVDRIITFPQQVERPVVQKLMRRRSVMSVVVTGDLDRWALRQQAEDIRDRILALPQVTQVDLSGIPPYEIAIEVSEQNLRRYNLTLESVAQAVRAASLDLPGGTVKAAGGEILLRTKERRYTAREYARVVVVSKPDGTLVRLGDIAMVSDTFRETDERSLFEGKLAAMIEVYRVGEQTPMEISDAVKALLAQHKKDLPPGVHLSVRFDRTEILKSRMDLLLRNAGLGLILVILILGLFLQLRLAFWVTLGIPLSMLGALILVQWTDVSINMISLFAFIVVLGIVVDDAIVVGENAFTHYGFGKLMPQAAPDGAQEVARPVTFSVLTTVAAFAPLLFVSGMMGKFMHSTPIIVIAVLMVSLIESLFVLPAHLSRCCVKGPDDPIHPLWRWHRRFARALDRFVAGPYTRVLHFSLRNRYATLAVAVAALMLTVGLFKGGYIKSIFMPELEGDMVHGRITMPFGTMPEVTERHLRRIEAAGRELIAEYDSKMPRKKSILRNVFSVVGGHLRRTSVSGGGGHLGEVSIFLQESDKRNVDSEVFARRWRRLVGEIPGAEAVDFTATMVHMGDPIDIQLAHEDFAVLEAAAGRLKQALSRFKGLRDITDSHEVGKRELKLKLRPEARALGITQRDLASQVRNAFYGAEAQRIQRGRNELRVMVRYPLSERRSLANVDSMRIRTPGGGEIPFAQAAQVSEGRGYSHISRTDRKRVIDVTAKANLKVANPAEIMDQLKREILPRLVADYRGLTYDTEGEMRERRESMSSLKWGFIVALGMIFALLAIPFRSYSQPLLVMLAIPFGIVGAVVGHMLLGYDMSLISLMGVVALTGVVVNDSLVLIDFINRIRAKGAGIARAVVEGGQRRFRPILLTTLTTFFALVPMLAETSVQARFLVPMAISLAFGVLFGTLITLVLVPALYLILEDLKGLAAWIRGRPARSDAGSARQSSGL